MRFRNELKSNLPNKAMELTMQSVLLPMFTTTVAALIGFQAMSLGDLTILQELGRIMSYGVFFCFLAAITIVPVISVLSENFFSNLKNKKNNKNKVKSGGALK